MPVNEAVNPGRCVEDLESFYLLHGIFDTPIAESSRDCGTGEAVFMVAAEEHNGLDKVCELGSAVDGS